MTGFSSAEVRSGDFARLVLAVVILAGLVVVFDPTPVSAVGAGQVILASHTPVRPATAPVGASGAPSSSADGAFVAFQSDATNVVAGQVDANGTNDVFLFERATGAVTLVSHLPLGTTTTANGASTYPSISADGAFVAFQSDATNLVAGQSDPNGQNDVFLFQRATGAVTLVSHTPASTTTTANGVSFTGAISADGASVTFESDATNLVVGQSDANSSHDVFLFLRATGTVTLVSHTPASTTTTNDGYSYRESISADGGFVAFESYATNLVAGQSDTNFNKDVFLFQRATGAVTVASHLPLGPTTTANNVSFRPVISADGSSVAFESFATNLVAGQSDTNSTIDVFLFGRATGGVLLMSHTPVSTTTTANGPSLGVTISADGASVAFRSDATNLAAGQTDTNANNDVFLFQRSTGAAVTLVSHTAASTNTTANGNSHGPTISADGAFVAFQSTATNLVAGQADGNGSTDVFIFRRKASRPPPADFDGDGKTDVSVFRPSTSSWYVHGSTGVDTTTNFGTSGDIPVPGDYDGNGVTDIAVFRPSTGTWYVRNGLSTNFGTSGDIPVPGDYDGNATTDVAVFRPSTGTWYVQGGTTVGFGTAGDIPVPGDYDGNATTDIAVFRPSTGTWYIQGGATVGFWISGDIPVPGDYDGNATTDIAVFRPSTGTWYVQGGIPVGWGTAGDIPVPGDYDGNATTDIGMVRPAAGRWFVRGGVTTGWGAAGDVPLPLPDAIRRFFFTPL